MRLRRRGGGDSRPRRARGITRGRSPMATLREWVTRLWGTLRPSRRDAELEEELRLHLELAAEDERRRANGQRGRRAGGGNPVRGYGAGDGGGARSARPAVARRPGSRPALRASRLAPESALRLGRGADARARHRREHGDLFPGGRRALPDASRQQRRETSSCFANAARAETSSRSPPLPPSISPQAATCFRGSRRSVRF